jgi:hypothetical protein
MQEWSDNNSSVELWNYIITRGVILADQNNNWKACQYAIALQNSDSLIVIANKAKPFADTSLAFLRGKTLQEVSGARFRLFVKVCYKEF